MTKGKVDQVISRNKLGLDGLRHEDSEEEEEADDDIWTSIKRIKRCRYMSTHAAAWKQVAHFMRSIEAEIGIKKNVKTTRKNKTKKPTEEHAKTRRWFAKDPSTIRARTFPRIDKPWHTKTTSF